jgi:hypothetical protein
MLKTFTILMLMGFSAQAADNQYITLAYNQYISGCPEVTDDDAIYAIDAYHLATTKRTFEYLGCLMEASARDRDAALLDKRISYNQQTELQVSLQQAVRERDDAVQADAAMVITGLVVGIVVTGFTFLVIGAK